MEKKLNIPFIARPFLALLVFPVILVGGVLMTIIVAVAMPLAIITNTVTVTKRYDNE